MQTENTKYEKEQEQLICSDEFDKALAKGSEVKSEISGTMRQRDKNNYDRFYELMLMCNPKVQSACYKRKKERTPEETALLKKFSKDVKVTYKLVRDMIFVPDEERDAPPPEDGTLPKRLKFVERLALLYPMLRYIGASDELDRAFAKHGITVMFTHLEDVSEAFENEQVRSDMKEVVETSCKIRSEIEDAKRSISDDIFHSMVPEKLQFDKDTNPGGIKDSDFKKLVEVKFKIIKSESADADAKEKATEKAFDEAEKRTFDIQRSKTVRAGLMALGTDESAVGG